MVNFHRERISSFNSQVTEKNSTSNNYYLLKELRGFERGSSLVKSVTNLVTILFL